jgi:diguanylate cyclase (GGDEF)-like protein
VTEQGPEFLEAIVEASRTLEVSIEDLTQDQLKRYIEQPSADRRKASISIKPDAIQESDWEKAKELAIILDASSRQIAEKYCFNIEASAGQSPEEEWTFNQFISVGSKKGVFGLSLITTLLCIIISIGILFIITLLSQSITFEQGIIPAIAIPLIAGPIVFYIIFTQSYHLTQAISKLEDLRRTDPLTRLYNWRFFSELVGMELAVASRYTFSSSLLLIDLDHFKRINDTYGHLAGDEVLRIISSVIKLNVRRTDVVGRLSGEEFIVFLPHTKLEGAMVAADRVRRIISESEITFKEDRIGITASIGVASTELEIADVEQLLHVAASALDVAKDKGRNLAASFPQITQENAVGSEVIEIQPG